MSTIGIDCGASSVRALVVRRADGAEFGCAMVGYPFGDEVALLDENDRRLARQAPAGLRGDLRLPIGAPRAVWWG